MCTLQFATRVRGVELGAAKSHKKSSATGEMLELKKTLTRMRMELSEHKKILETKNGFISAHWDGSSETENKIKDMTKATIRCIPFDNKVENGRCVLTGRPSTQRVLFAKAY